jgi:hypothetical protein
MEDTIDPIPPLQAEFGPAFAGNVIQEEVERIGQEMNEAIRLIIKLSVYLTATQYGDQQRRVAEARLFSLQSELAELQEALSRTLVMAPDLGRVVTINT